MQLFIKFANNSKVYDVDKSLTICQLKNLIEDIEYIPNDLQYLTNSGKILNNGTLEDNKLENESHIDVNLRILGGSCRYKKSTSRLRWKTKLKRMRKLKATRRKNRLRSR
uniref:Ubiquitin-like domain-containing protein n=1 Tax=viral metagenome TaxID=1070528 RepID=A0A6C0KYV1_9ZZZZ|tara:strand:+ start:10247 stop:10576 length:330 start_codon:yes stop_codon:yes gene_type:complete